MPLEGGGYPTDAKFPEVRAYPAYTTVDAVLAELPPRVASETVPREKVEFVIDTQANRVDMALLRYYALPAPPLIPPGLPPGPDEAGLLPSELERINRYYAVAELLVGLLDLRDEQDKGADWWSDEADKALEALIKGDVLLAYPFLHPSGRPYFVPLAPGSPLYSRHPLSATRRLRYAYPAHRYVTSDGDPGGVLS